MAGLTMSITNYDKGIVKYFEDIYENVVWGDPNTAFKNNAMKHEDKVLLPMLSVYRPEIMLDPSINFAQLKKGAALEIDQFSVTRERTLPLILSYQLDVWATGNDQAAALFAEVLFYTMDKPGVPIEISGADNPVIQYLTITDVVDNTDTTQIASRGRLCRFTILYQIRAHIVKLEKNDRIKVVPEFYTYDGKQLK